MSIAPCTVAGLVAWLEQAPAGTTLQAAAVLELLRGVATAEPAPAPPATAEGTWRVWLWTAPPETRLGVRELAEAVDRPVSWVHRHTSRKSGLPQLPHRKLDGELVFVVGEIRRWLEEHEDVCVAGTVTTPITPLPRKRAS